MLDLFGMQQGGSQYRRLIAAFQRVFEATIFFGSDMQREKEMVMHHGRFNFMREARIWYSRNSEREVLPGAFENEVVLSNRLASIGKSGCMARHVGRWSTTVIGRASTTVAIVRQFVTASKESKRSARVIPMSML